MTIFRVGFFEISPSSTASKIAPFDDENPWLSAVRGLMRSHLITADTVADPNVLLLNQVPTQQAVVPQYNIFATKYPESPLPYIAPPIH